jgi:tetratricopeptide (TPR) repeat protein
MRPIAVLVIATQICLFASTTWAETQVKADDCSSAVSGTMIGSHIEVHCLGKEDIARVVDELVRQGVVKRAEDVGIEGSVIVSLAARLKPTEKLDLVQAVVEVSHAVDVAMGVVAEGSSGSSDQLLDEVLKRVADKTKANNPQGATREAEEGFARWEKEEGERRANATATGVTLLEAALKTDLLRFDTAAAAGRVENIASLQHPDDPQALFIAVRTRQNQFLEEGDNKGVNLSLAVAVAIARRAVVLARNPDQRGDSLNDHGVALASLGGREGGEDKLEEAVRSLRGALEERPRERVPLVWAQSQMNLGVALETLGKLENGTQQLEEAVRACRASLEVRTHVLFPHDWAETQVNLGIALELLGEREDETSRLTESVAAFRAALQELTRERTPHDWALTQVDLGGALRVIGERESGTAKLEEAIAAFREALSELSQERTPLYWAGTQSNLGGALQALGERESGTGSLTGAVAAYGEALKEYTRERSPLDWAVTQDNLGSALEVLGERESGTKDLEAAVAAHRKALEIRTRERVPLDWARTQNNLGTALTSLGQRENGTTALKEAVEAHRAALKEGRGIASLSPGQQEKTTWA